MRHLTPKTWIHRFCLFSCLVFCSSVAAQAFGGVLPDIARETVDLAREMLLEWMEADEAPEDAEDLGLVA